MSKNNKIKKYLNSSLEDKLYSLAKQKGLVYDLFDSLSIINYSFSSDNVKLIEKDFEKYINKKVEDSEPLEMYLRLCPTCAAKLYSSSSSVNKYVNENLIWLIFNFNLDQVSEFVSNLESKIPFEYISFAYMGLSSLIYNKACKGNSKELPQCNKKLQLEYATKLRLILKSQGKDLLLADVFRKKIRSENLANYAAFFISANMKDFAKGYLIDWSETDSLDKDFIKEFESLIDYKELRMRKDNSIQDLDKYLKKVVRRFERKLKRDISGLWKSGPLFSAFGVTETYLGIINQVNFYTPFGMLLYFSSAASFFGGAFASMGYYWLREKYNIAREKFKESKWI